MNTCAECRFWKAISLGNRFFRRDPSVGQPGDWKECDRSRADGAPFYIASIGADDEALMTRSDFGCVQFEKKPVDLTGIPISDTAVVTSRNLRRPDSST